VGRENKESCEQGPAEGALFSGKPDTLTIYEFEKEFIT
jgi:hypothetical protein